MTTKTLSRRTVLRGLGTALALPMLECMAPAPLLAAVNAAQKTGPAPKRMAFLYVPNGIHMPDWTPEEEGASYKLPPTLEPLAKFKKEMLVLSGLTQNWARSHGDGGGDHARAMSVYLTGCKAKKTHGADIKVGISADQVAAQLIGSATRFASLEIGCDTGQQAGNCDSGYSCAYSSNLSWRTESTPVAKETNPKAVFERLFGTGDDKAAAARGSREAYQKSVLDFVLDDAKRLHGKLGRNDQRKLDDYLSAVREVEQRLSRSEKAELEDAPKFAKPTGKPKDYGEHLRLMADLLVLAFQTDSTRIATFALANESSGRSYPWLDVHEGHHELSHHGGSKEKQAKIAKINKFHVEQLAYFLGKMQEVKEGTGTLLDNSLISYGSCIGDGDRHNHDNLPTLLFGRGGGTIKPGRHIKYPKETPLNNLWLAMLERAGAKAEKIGDSSGALRGLDG